MAKKGEVLSPEVRAKISAAKKGRKCTPEQIEKMRQAHQGLKHTEETKAKMSATHKGKPAPEGMGERMRQCNTGRRHTEEARRAMSEARRGQPKSEEHKAKITEAHKQRMLDPVKREERARIIRRVAANLTPEQRKAASVAGRLGCMRAVSERGSTSIERAIAKVLDGLGVEYKPQNLMGFYVMDFYVPQYNLVIECDGTYWHSKPGARRRDIIKNKWIRSQGMLLVRLWEHDIKRDPLGCLTAACSKIGITLDGNHRQLSLQW